MPIHPEPGAFNAPRPPFSVGRSLVAFAAFASPGLIAAAVVWPLLRDRWKPVAAIVLAGTTVLSLGLAGAVGWLGRRQLPSGDGEVDARPPREPGINHRERGEE